MKTNQDIRNLLKENGLKHWQLAEKLGIREDALSVMFRHEMDRETKQKIIDAIGTDVKNV